jgi:hypothetical protein
MSLDLVGLLPQVEQLVESTVSRRTLADRYLPELRDAFDNFGSVDQELLHKKLEIAGENWPAALPALGSLHEIYPPPPHQNKFKVIATDGSQIYPDRHGPAYYYLINVGLFSLEHGSGSPPEVSNLVKMYFTEDELYNEFGSAISNSVINGQRDVMELEGLALLASSAGEGPTLALLDNGLLLWLAAQGGEPRSRAVDKLLHQYLGHLSSIQKSGASLAGLIDRPRHWNTVALLSLSVTVLEEVKDLQVSSHPIRTITDRGFFKLMLQPGYRSSLLIQRSKLNSEFEIFGQGIYFFYLHTGAGDNIVRVEVPEWVARSKEHLDIVHSSIVQQCQQTAGYPYALIRAHETAVVSNSDRQHFEALIQRRLLERGLRFTRSIKSESKRWTGEKRRHSV